MVTKLPLAEAAWEIGPQVVADRRYLHQHPELGFQEENTARFVAEKLRSFGIETRTGVAKTGVVGLLRGDRPGKTVLLRADMDALPIEELNDVPYKSGTPGVMHACGHDSHTAMLLGVARLLAERKDEIKGTVKFVFQPSEEVPPGGAKPMIEEGVLEDPRVDAAFGVHIGQDLPVGTIGVCAGPTNAASDGFIATIKGVGGHAARPHGCVDPIVVAAQCIGALQTLVSREVNPLRQAVITVGSLHAGTVSNIIPEEAIMKATVRTFDEEVRQNLAERIPALITGIAAAMRAEAEVQYRFGYPALVNDPAMTDLVRAVAREVVGPDKVVEREPGMGGEDMSYFLQRVPGCFFRIGSRNYERGLIHGHHHPRFDIDDEGALPVGVAAVAAVALRFLNGEA
ncbi:MAG: N-acetyl-L,L-diaminopimelate deacetylase [uncultured Thermomicrobiales bacterium]|uniref:N-acetyl-L,L-diaminopimelate deacetylase n=1 Tax=uncultured Thermomicrobiales bacterium TaxID=1645740 RepID=A0A6J4VHZ1_9BACT|nr:MAG: N-acetyl-L,L-diaminopimelate deacetylase [uncultured Thermomicrobiales bacterium]